MEKKELIKSVRLIGLSRLVYENVNKTKSFELGKYVREKLVEEFGTTEAKKKFLLLHLNSLQKERNNLDKKIEQLAKKISKLKCV